MSLKEYDPPLTLNAIRAVAQSGHDRFEAPINNVRARELLADVDAERMNLRRELEEKWHRRQDNWRASSERCLAESQAQVTTLTAELATAKSDSDTWHQMYLRANAREKSLAEQLDESRATMNRVCGGMSERATQANEKIVALTATLDQVRAALAGPTEAGITLLLIRNALATAGAPDAGHLPFDEEDMQLAGITPPEPKGPEVQTMFPMAQAAWDKMTSDLAAAKARIAAYERGARDWSDTKMELAEANARIGQLSEAALKYADDLAEANARADREKSRADAAEDRLIEQVAFGDTWREGMAKAENRCHQLAARVRELEEQAKVCHAANDDLVNRHLASQITPEDRAVLEAARLVPDEALHAPITHAEKLFPLCDAIQVARREAKARREA